MDNKDKILDFSNWTECGNGWDGKYRYVIGAKSAYEIMVLYHDIETDILTARGTLYLTGMWNIHSLEKNIEHTSRIFNRECLLPKDMSEGLPIQELLKLARKDFDNIEYI